MTRLKIGNYLIENYGRPFIIAEVGINHNGDLKKALKMIEVAKAAGADCVKFQTFKAKELVTDERLAYTYTSQGKKVTESMLKMFERYEFSEEQWKVIRKKCTKEKIMFLSTPQNETDLIFLKKLGIPAIKIGSDDFTNLPLLKKYASHKLPLILSCGMADQTEVKDSLAAAGSSARTPLVLLLCTSQYPTPLQDANILKLDTLRKCFPDLVLGFSDHTQGVIAATLAVGLGAVVFEKHFTLDNDLPGPDHWFSENPKTLEHWITSIRAAHIALGSCIIKPTKAEEKMRLLARRSLATLKAIAKGERFTPGNTGLKRPGTGLPPKYFNDIIGRKATRDLCADRLIKKGDYL